MTRTLTLAAALSVLLLGGCFLLPSGTSVSSGDIAAFQKVFMSSYFAERGGAPDSGKGLTPFRTAVAGSGSKATVPTGLLTNPSFASLAPLTFSNYPEPGQTTSFTATSYDAANHVYAIKATTTYPSGDLRSQYVEEYYVEDGNPTFSTAADGTWDTNDPIVKLSGSTWVQDQKARVQQVLTFTDGTTRTETIVAQTKDWGLAPTNTPKFASFDVNGSLDFSQSFVPDGSGSPANIVFSSVVVYTVTPSVTTNFSFWQGTQAQSIVGIRYYTEYKDTGAAKTFSSTTVSFEKTVDTLTTTGGSFSTTLATVFAGSQFSTLAESVLRQQVTYSLDGSNNIILSTGVKTTRMQTRVADITSSRDFYLSQLDSDSAALGSWTTSSIYTPTGNVEELIAADPGTFVYTRTLAGSAGSAPLYHDTATITDLLGTGDLATVYGSIQEGAATISTGTTIPGSIIPGGVEWSYGGSQGTTLPNTPAWQLGAAGSVEAWLFMTALTDTAGIVHKGVLPSFADEAYSLQFWGNTGTIAMVLDKPGSAGASYDLVTSTINLNLNKWYYVVATWDTTVSPKKLNLYVNGTLNNSTTITQATSGADSTNLSDLLIGSQLPTQYSAQYGYFGFKGRINGVRISSSAMSAASVASNYATYVLQTPNW
jgi:hypothetical protein